MVGSPCSPRDSQESSPTPQFKSINLWRSGFFMTLLSQPYMTTGKTIALTRWTFLSKGMSLLFNMLSRLVIAFLPRSKSLLISWLQSPSAGILEPKKIKSYYFPIYLPWSDGTTEVTDFIFGGSKITADGVCSHEIKGRLLLGRKATTNLDRILKSRDITLLTIVHLVNLWLFQ